MSQIKYFIRSGKLTDEGVVNTTLELYNKIKSFPDFEKLEAERVNKKDAGNLQK